MRNISLEEAADYLESATIIDTQDFGHSIIHTGITTLGTRFVMINDMNGGTILTESA